MFWVGFDGLADKEVARSQCEDSFIVMLGNCQNGPGVEAGLNLASHCCHLLKCEGTGANDSFEVVFHALHSCLPETPKVWGPFWDHLPGESVF